MKKIILYLICVVLLTSCHSSKKVAEKVADSKAKVEVLNKSDLKVEAGTNFTSKVKATIDRNGTGLSTNGTFRMRRDEVIQLALVDPYLGAMEVGRMELSKDAVLIIDRMNKRYMSETYESLSAMAGTNITFDMVQDLFWGEVKAGRKEISFTLPVATPVKFTFALSNIGSDAGWEPHTKVSSKYSQVSMEEIIKMFAGHE